ncbi:MAG: leucine-rich repeat domain-containing protein [Ruminococcus sp.]|nr:leucine-rich repeat domain-containing protein [Ruminococcus sp.]
MSFSFGFFNAKNMDRTYTAEDFTGYLSSIICNGVFDTYGDCFSVTAGSGTKVIIGTGKAWIDGHYFINDTAYTLDLSRYVDESLSRYVTIGISCDVSENIRACKLEVKSGTASTTPAIPVFEDTASKKHLTLAAVFLKGGAKSITDGNIRDMRENEEKCGYVKCVLGKCRVSEMLVAVAFMTDKMNEMVGKIDTLQSTVDNLQLKVDDLTGDIVATGPLGKDIYYVLYSNGNLLVRGTGEMYDYDIDGNQSPFLNNNEIQTVVVSEGVTTIGENVFENCQNMGKISLPTTLTSIGHAAFMQGDGYVSTVYGLTEITIPSGVTSIGGSAFWGSAISSLVIPESVTEIGKYVCRDCAALKNVTVNGTVIGEFMFVSCIKLSTFNIGSKLKKIGSNVFNYCSALKTITYDGTLEKWQAIEKGSNWDGRSAMETAQSGLVKIQCTDGYMEYADGAWREVIA